ncbi:fimbria/pilus periplasmic chaperone [Klebsiella pneumoniae subsp. pneumoniae]|nr:fimbria/pilus periplasmic chaperone [Klebsiella pneumoniae subsp. pneumoniae]
MSPARTILCARFFTGANLAQDRESLFWLNIKTIPSVKKTRVQSKYICSWRSKKAEIYLSSFNCKRLA